LHSSATHGILGAMWKMKIVWLFAGLLIVAVGLYLTLLLGLWVFQERIMFAGRTREIVQTPKEMGWAYEDVWMDVGGERTHGWWVPLVDARGIILYSHGSGKNISHYLDDTEIFRQLGYSVLLYDYGGYGESTGEPSEQRCYADIRAMWDYLTVNKKIQPSGIILAGSSMGGGVTSDLAAEVTPAAVILECTFTSVPEALRDTYWFVPQSIVRIQFRNADKAPKFTSPVVVIHSTDDTVVPYAHGRALYSRILTPRAFIEIHGGHAGGKFDSRDIYVDGLKTFLYRHVK